MEGRDRKEKRKYVYGDASDEENGSARKRIKLEGEYGQTLNRATRPRPKSRFFHESEMQKWRIRLTQISNDPSSGHYTSYDNNANPCAAAAKEEKNKESQALDASELNEADLSTNEDEDYKEEFIKEEDLEWLNLLRILQKEFVARNTNYEPVVATAQNQLRQNQIMSMAEMIDDECSTKLDMLSESMGEIEGFRDELVHRISEIGINSEEDVMFQDLLKQLDDLEVQKEALSDERRFFLGKWKTIQRIKNAKMFDSSCVAGELTRQFHSKHGY